MALMSYFGDIFKATRQGKGITQERLAKLMGYAQTNLSNIETGRKKPSPAVMEALANIPELGLTLDQLQCWKLIDEYPPELIEMAHKMLEQQKTGD